MSAINVLLGQGKIGASAPGTILDWRLAAVVIPHDTVTKVAVIALNHFFHGRSPSSAIVITDCDEDRPLADRAIGREGVPVPLIGMEPGFTPLETVHRVAVATRHRVRLVEWKLTMSDDLHYSSVSF
jgi:hypothetical protein